jgi:hypothetical protein
MTNQLFVSGSMVVLVIHFLLTEAYHTNAAAAFEQQV